MKKHSIYRDLCQMLTSTVRIIHIAFAVLIQVPLKSRRIALNGISNGPPVIFIVFLSAMRKYFCHGFLKLRYNQVKTQFIFVILSTFVHLILLLNKS